MIHSTDKSSPRGRARAPVGAAKSCVTRDASEGLTLSDPPAAVGVPQQVRERDAATSARQRCYRFVWCAGQHFRELGDALEGNARVGLVLGPQPGELEDAMAEGIQPVRAHAAARIPFRELVFKS